MRRRPPTRTQRARLSLLERAASECWHADVVAGGCVMCRAFPPSVDSSLAFMVRRVQAHHVIPKERLKREGLHEYLWDRSNGIALCLYHHERHHGYNQRVPRSLVRHTEPFAREHGLLALLDREYPA